MTMWYLSFCDSAKPAGQQFLGALMLDVPPGKHPVDHAWDMGLNPGGEVVVLSVPPHRVHRFTPDMLNRLLTREEVEAFDRKWSS